MTESPFPIMGLDMATSTGWSFLAGPDEQIEFGAKGLHGGNDGVVGRAMLSWLETEFAARRPAMIYAEDVFLRGHATIRLCGFKMLLNMAAHKNGALVRYVAPRRLKKSFTGSGGADKNRMIRRCQELGLYPKTEDEADAIALLVHGLAIEAPDVAAARTFSLVA